MNENAEDAFDREDGITGRNGTDETGTARVPESKKRLKKRLIRFDRKVSWVLFIFTLLTIVTGYLLTRMESQPSPTSLHVALTIIFVILLLFHTFVVTFLVRYRWKVSFTQVLHNEAKAASLLTFIQRVSGIFLFVFAAFLVLSGLDYSLSPGEPFTLFWHVHADILFYTAFTVHMGAGLKVAFNRRNIDRVVANGLVLVFVIGLVLVAVVFESGVFFTATEEPGNRLEINGMSYGMDMSQFNRSRPDIFQENQYSVFDALVRVSEEQNLELKYHFDGTLDTYVIDSLSGREGWWYEVYYDGGFSSSPFGEKNFHRMDQYPCKEGTLVRMISIGPARLEEKYEYFRTEVQRRERNGGKVIIPVVTIRGDTFTESFADVEVVPHNLRNDTFQDGVVTAIDTILTLGDQGLITYDLQWYDSIGTAQVVRSYFVEGINNDTRSGRCGFVYECGEYGYTYNSGNHIHIPSDWRVLTSPAYLEYFWLCI